MLILIEMMLMLTLTMVMIQVTSLSKWDSLVGEEGLLKPSERPVVLNRSPFYFCLIVSNFVHFCLSVSTFCQFCLLKPSGGSVVIKKSLIFA